MNKEDTMFLETAQTLLLPRPDESKGTPQDYPPPGGTIFYRPKVKPWKPHPGPLALELGDRTIRLLAASSERTISLGKHRSNDLVTCIFNAKGRANKRQNERISRAHCRIERRPGESILIDGGFTPDKKVGKASAWGTFLNGYRLPELGQAPLPMNADFTLSLAGKDRRDVRAFFLKGHITRGKVTQHGVRLNPNASNKPHEPAYLYLERIDRIRESYLIVWHCCDLKAIHPALAGLVLWNMEDGLAFVHHDIQQPLLPNVVLRLSGQAFSVIDQPQFGIDAK